MSWSIRLLFTGLALISSICASSSSFISRMSFICAVMAACMVIKALVVAAMSAVEVDGVGWSGFVWALMVDFALRFGALLTTVISGSDSVSVSVEFWYIGILGRPRGFVLALLTFCCVMREVFLVGGIFVTWRGDVVCRERRIPWEVLVRLLLGR